MTTLTIVILRRSEASRSDAESNEGSLYPEGSAKSATLTTVLLNAVEGPRRGQRNKCSLREFR
jgi:hypothetical protein